jgi:CYTH domain-containing protein
VIAEVEIKNIDENIKISKWIGKEITNNDRFSDYFLALFGILKEFKK